MGATWPDSEGMQAVMLEARADCVLCTRETVCQHHEPIFEMLADLEADRDEERRLRLCAENDMHNAQTEVEELRDQGCCDECEAD